jgi:hypothetical protein
MSTTCEKLTPCRIREDGTPEFDGIRWGSEMHLMGDLAHNRLPEPCWIRCGRSAYKIDTGESPIMSRAILIGYEIKEFSTDH